MKILFITYDFPYPANSGGKVRAYNLIKNAISKEFEIYLFSFIRKNISESDFDELRKIGIKKITTYKRSRIDDPRNFPSLIGGNSVFKTLYYKKEVEEILIKLISDNSIDLLHAESFYTGFYINEVIQKTGVKMLYGSENIEQHVYREYVDNRVTPFLRPLYNLQVNQIQKEENSMIEKADASVAVTHDEAKFIEKISKKSTFVIPNGVEVKDFDFKKNSNDDFSKLLFIGNFTYFPNIEAMKFIFEKVYARLPSNITLTIVGKKASQLFSNKKNVVAKDYVEDIHQEYRNADAFIFPVQFGGGTNFKVLEAMASGLPVVGFPQKIGSIGAKENVHFLAAITPDEFLKAINKLRADKLLLNKITSNARDLIEKEYEWKKIGKSLQDAWRSTYEN